MQKFLLLLLLFTGTQIRAQNAETDTLQIKERIQTIQSMLTESETPVNVWWYGWLGAYSVATVGQGTVCFLTDDVPLKQDMALGAATTFLGGALQLITPLNTGKDARLLAQLPETTPQEQLFKLQMAEKYLQTNAMTEKAGRSWQIHALNTAVNLSSGLITWLAFKRTVWDGVSNFLLNTVITETQIWTQPTRTWKDYQRYCRQYKQGEIVVNNKIQPEFYVNTFAGGVSLKIVF